MTPCATARAETFALITLSDVSRTSDISIQTYLRSAPPSSEEGSTGIGNQDLFLGGVKFMPEFDGENSQSEQWHQISGGTGELNIQVGFKPAQVSLSLPGRRGSV